MSYEPNEWQTGDVVTAVKLNNIEYGIENNAGIKITNDNSGKAVLDGEVIGSVAIHSLAADGAFVTYEPKNLPGNVMFLTYHSEQYGCAFSGYKFSENAIIFHYYAVALDGTITAFNKSVPAT